MVKNKTFKLIILCVCLGIIVVSIIACVVSIIARAKIRNDKISEAKENLFSAIVEGDMSTIESILEEYPRLINAKPHSSDLIARFFESGNATPLLEAIRLNNIDLIKYLVKNGADVNISNGTIESYPIIEILNRGFGELAEIRYEMAWLLIENGADLTVGQQYYTVPYSIVSVKIAEPDSPLQQQSLELMKYVIEQEISLDPPDPTNSQSGDFYRHTWHEINEIIGWAARKNHILVTEYFLQSNMYSVDDIVALDGSTSLIQAVKGQSLGTCKLLIEYGADTTIVDDHGKSAYDYAVEIGDQEIIDLLEKHTDKK